MLCSFRNEGPKIKGLNGDMALVENYVPYQEGVSSTFSLYSEVLHLFYTLVERTSLTVW